jgi:hypothetical protein
VLSKFNRPAFGDGRYYTATGQTGQILGFGSPVRLPLDCGGPFDFGEVSIGQSNTINVTCTAIIAITKVANVTIGNPLYNVSTTSLPTGAIPAGNSFTFSVTFNLTNYVLRSGSTSSPSVVPGTQSGSITFSTQNSVTGYSTLQPLSVTGRVVTSGPFAAISPVNVDFSPLVLGSAAAAGGSQNTMVIQNLGKSAMTITGYGFTTNSPTSASAVFTNITTDSGGTSILDANGYFTASDLPAIGSIIGAGSSVVVHLTFASNTLGDFWTTFVLWSDGGMADTVMTGSADSVPIALLEVSTSEGGWTTIANCPDPSTSCTYQIDMGTSYGPTTTEITLRFTNNGGSDMIISKSKPPEGDVLGAENPSTDFYEGEIIVPGGSTTGTIFFTPGTSILNADPIYYSGAWTLNVNDLTFGVHVVNFTGILAAKQTGPALADGSPRFKYLGCYQDSTAARLETGSTNIANNTNGDCQAYAVTQVAAFAGTECKCFFPICHSSWMCSSEPRGHVTDWSPQSWYRYHRVLVRSQYT